MEVDFEDATQKESQTQAWSCLHSAEVKDEQKVQIKHLHDKHGTDHSICKELWFKPSCA